MTLAELDEFAESLTEAVLYRRRAFRRCDEIGHCWKDDKHDEDCARCYWCGALKLPEIA